MDQFPGIAAQLDARRGIPEEFAARLAHAVEPLGVELCFQPPGLGLRLDAHGLGVKDTVHQIGIEDRAEDNVGIGVRQVLPVQGVAVLNAADIRRENAVRPGVGEIHPQIGTVQFGQPAGQCRHIRAGRIAALQHQSQHGGIGGGLPPRRKRRWMVMRQRLNFEASSVVMKTPAQVAYVPKCYSFPTNRYRYYTACAPKSKPTRSKSSPAKGILGKTLIFFKKRLTPTGFAAIL